MKTAKLLKKTGVPVLRGGAYKPRTSPHSFQGLREGGLELLDEVRKETGLLVVTEVVSPEHVGLVAEHVDILQIGATQHAELRPPDRDRQDQEARDPETRTFGNSRRMARFRGIHPARRQPERRAVRARHPNVRNGDAGIPQTSRSSRWSGRRPICRSSSTRATRRARGTWSARWRWLPLLPARRA